MRTYFLHAIAATSLGLCLAANSSAQANSSLTLGEAVTQAEAHHPLMEAAGATVDAAAASLKEALSSRLPTVGLSEDIVFSNDPVFAFGSKLRQGRFAQSDFTLDSLNHPNALADFDGSASAEWTAFDGTRGHRIAGAKAVKASSEMQRRYTAEELAVEIARLYYRTLTAEDQVAIAQHASERAQELNSSVADRVGAGLALEVDGSQAHLGLLNAEDDLAQARDNVALARHDLFAAIGVADSGQSLDRPGSFDKGLARAAGAGDIQLRFDLRALDARLQAAKDAQATARAMALPRLSTFARVENDSGQLVRNGSGNWSVGARLQFDVFDGGSRKASEAKSAAEVRSLEAKRHAELLKAGSTITALSNQLDDLQRRLATSGEAIHVQQEALQTAKDRYSSGLDPLSDVLSAETDLAAAEFAHVRVRYQILITSADLALASGTPLESKAGQP